MEILKFLSDTAMMNLTLSELMCALAALLGLVPIWVPHRLIDLAVERSVEMPHSGCHAPTRLALPV